MVLYDDYLSQKELLQLCHIGPYGAIFTNKIVVDCLKKLEANNYVFSVLSISEQKKIYKPLSHCKPQIDIADKVIIYRSLLQFYCKKEKVDYKHLIHAFEIATELKEKDKQLIFAIKIVKTALQMGYIVNDNVINVLAKDEAYTSRMLTGIYFFCNANYQNAKYILEMLLFEKENRSLRVMYAISLNRCREHLEAENLFLSLIQSYDNIDELSILVTFLISNYVHSGNLNKAKETFEKYDDQLQSSRKYPYFLRNSATIFGFEKAYNLRSTAKNLFMEMNDQFGYYTTIVNMSAYYIKTDVDYAVKQIQMSYEELQQYNAQQIHLAANNLGICYLCKDNYLQAMKYFNLCIEIAKTIMPITYASINLSNMYIKMGKDKDAYECIHKLEMRVNSSNLPRLKARFYYQAAFVNYIKGDFDTASKNIDLARANSYSTATKKYFSSMSFLSQKISDRIIYSEDMWDNLFSPCFLEYWTINSIDVLDNNLLPI